MKTHVFYAPHPDDEVLGMGGAIARAKLEGDRVLIVLVTDSRPSPRAVNLFSGRLGCAWHGSRHWCAQHLATARMVEFKEAAQILGADELHLMNIPERDAPAQQPVFVEEIVTSVRFFERRFPGATHHLVASPHDLHFETRQGNNSHRACWDAGVSLAREIDVVFHRVYAYSCPREERHNKAAIVVDLEPGIMATKIAALNAYRVWDPDNGRLAYGYHSVPELFEAAGADPREFVDLAPVAVGAL